MARAEPTFNTATSKDFSQDALKKEKGRRDGQTGNNVTEKPIYYRDVALIRFKDENV